MVTAAPPDALGEAAAGEFFVGWFGPVGAAEMFYALETQDMTGLGMLWSIVSLAAAASVMAHGVTGTYFPALLGDRLRERLAIP